MFKQILLAAAVIAPLVPAAATQPLRSFAYESSGCSSYGGSPMLTFNGGFFMNAGDPPGAGQFPQGSFYIRKVGVTYFAPGENDSVVIGHSGPNGDWVTPSVRTGASVIVDYPADAAPLFTPGEYFDAHVDGCAPGSFVTVVIWYAPAL